MQATTLPCIIQGGMGVGISSWALARAVSQKGQLGVVSGTAVHHLLIRRLMQGDPNGNMRRALAAFPCAMTAASILETYFVEGGKPAQMPFKIAAPFSINPDPSLQQLVTVAGFVEVFLAKEGHGGVVGVNLLEKVQMPNIAALYGAMLAGVDVVLMGAGIPTQISGILDKLAGHQVVNYRLDVHGAAADDNFRMRFAPSELFPQFVSQVGQLKRPFFLPIVSSVTLAQALLKRSEGTIDGFVIEGPTAGGHNAPPRGGGQTNASGEPVYGDRDVVDLTRFTALGRPFWLAGGYAHPGQLRAALDSGANGVQVGTAFALCEESGMAPELRETMLAMLAADQRSAGSSTAPDIVPISSLQVHTSARASPTGFPFKVVPLEHTLAEHSVYDDRPRLCDIGMLREIYKMSDGSLGYRCAAEPAAQYLQKGGKLEDADNRICLCNSLCATAGFAQQRRSGYLEPALVTAGDDLVNAWRYLKPGRDSYSAADVIDYVLGN